MKAFTVNNGWTIEGVGVRKFTLSNGVSIPAVTVGEKGRGRSLGVLPVELSPESNWTFQEKGEVVIKSVEIKKTLSGNPKLKECQHKEDAEKCLCVIRAQMGFRGTGHVAGDSEKIEDGNLVGETQFPGEILVRGYVADGIAGRMGSAEQLVAVVGKGEVFSLIRTGRLYGNPARHFCRFDGEKVEIVSAQERLISDLWIEKFCK